MACLPTARLEALEQRILLSQSQDGFDVSLLMEPNLLEALPQERSASGADWAEPNYSVKTAFNLGQSDSSRHFSGLSIHRQNDVDWFKFGLASAGTQDDLVKIGFDPSAGDLDVQLFNNDGQMIDLSASRDDQEVISMQGYHAGIYYIKVYAYSKVQNPQYWLELQTGKPEQLKLDWSEPNHSFVAATDLQSVAGSGNQWKKLSVHQAGDEDWFRFQIQQPGRRGDAIITQAQLGSAVYIDLFDEHGTLLRSSNINDARQSVSLEGLPAGVYKVRTSAAQSNVVRDYSLTINAPPQTIQRKWTVMVYLDADNNLEPYALGDINQMESVKLPSSITVAVQLDRIEGYDNSWDDWSDTRRGIITNDNKPEIISSYFLSVGEQNMGSQQTLTDFIRWGVSTYPADNYALILWDHGNGLTGLCTDNTDEDHLSLQEMADGIAQAGVKIDLVGFDACYMGMMEVISSLSPYTDVVVASQSTEPAEGWDYKRLLSRLASRPNMTAGQFGSAIVSSYAACYGKHDTLSATRTNVYASLINAMNRFAKQALSANAAEMARIVSARNNSPMFGDNTYRDLRTFISRLTSLPSSLGARARVLIATLDKCVIRNHSGTSERGKGISVYLPGSPYDDLMSIYLDYPVDAFSGSYWGQFVQTLATHVEARKVQLSLERAAWAGEPDNYVPWLEANLLREGRYSHLPITEDIFAQA